MDIETLKALGVTPEKLIEAAVDRLLDRRLGGEYADVEDAIRQQTQEIAIKQLNEKVEAYLSEHMRPVIDRAVEMLSVPNTNRYGEPKGEPMPFIEYVTKCANEHLTEMVGEDGRKEQYGSNFKQTRLMWYFNKYLGHSVNTAINAAVGKSLEALGDSIAKLVKEKTEAMVAVSRVEVRVK